MAGGILDLVFGLLSLAIRLGIVVVATPIVLAWPRPDRDSGYWETVRGRYAAVLKIAFF